MKSSHHAIILPTVSCVISYYKIMLYREMLGCAIIVSFFIEDFFSPINSLYSQKDDGMM